LQIIKYVTNHPDNRWGFASLNYLSYIGL
jgi:hypothetical protein